MPSFKKLFSSFKKILDKRKKEYYFWPVILGLEIRRLWQKEIKENFGPEFSKKTQPLSFRSGILVVKVKDPLFSQEIRFRESEMIEKINKKIKEPRLKKIVYRTEKF